MAKLASDLNFVLNNTLDKQKQAIVFVPTKASAEAGAESLAKLLSKSKNPDEYMQKLSNDIQTVLSSPTKQCNRLSECIKQGVAFHHSGLVSKQRHLIEHNFRDNKVKIIFATPTLAMGVDLPAFRTIITSLKRYSSMGYNWIPVMEYLQMAGRAGRKGQEDYGESIVIAKSENELEIIKDRFLYAQPEPIFSKLAVEPVLRTYLLALVSMNFVNSKSSIMNFFEKTFFAHQYSDRSKLHHLVEKQLELLDEFGFVSKIKSRNEKKNSLFESAAKLLSKQKQENFENYNATPLGILVARLYLDPVSAYRIIQGLSKAKDDLEYLKSNSFPFFVVLSELLELRPLPTVRVADERELEELMLRYQSSFLLPIPESYDINYPYFLSALKLSWIIFDWMNEIEDDALMTKYNMRPGELRNKIETFDWLLYSSIEISKQLGYKQVVPFLAKQRKRLKYGVKEELLNLLRLKNIGKKRARKLFARGIKTTSDITEKDFNHVKNIVGEAIAKSIFKQLNYVVSFEFVEDNKKSKPQSSDKKKSSLLNY